MERVAGWLRVGDIKTFFWVNRSWKCSLTDVVMPLVTHLGGAVGSILLTCSFLLNGDSYWRRTGVHLALSLIVSHLVVALCKKVVPRPRPYQVLDNVFTGRWLLHDASFPSGHATASFCMATVLSMVFPALHVLFYALASMVAFSRVYLGLHYPSDIAIGAVLGMTTAWLLA